MIDQGQLILAAQSKYEIIGNMHEVFIKIWSFMDVQILVKGKN